MSEDNIDAETVADELTDKLGVHDVNVKIWTNHVKVEIFAKEGSLTNLHVEPFELDEVVVMDDFTRFDFKADRDDLGT